MPRLPRAALALAVLALSALPATAAPALPGQVTFQGRLTDAAGNPVDADVSMTFSVYAAASGGSPLWHETQTVHVSGGLYSVHLGSQTSLDGLTLDMGADRWLGVQVGTDSEMTPRYPLTGALYARRASLAERALTADAVSDADTVDGFHAAAFAPVSHAHDASTLTGTLSLAHGGTGATVFASGSVVFSNGTTLAGNPAGLFWDASSLRLGIGTGTPSRTLHVAGDGRVDGALRVGALEIAGDAVPVAGAPPTIPILDNNPGGVTDTVIVPDLGTAERVTVSVTLTNSNIAGIRIVLTDPDNTTHVLKDFGGSAGTTIDTTWPVPTPLVSGNLGAWNGRNPQGAWTLKVTDNAFLNNGIDGQVDAWSVIVHRSGISVTGAASLAAASGTPPIGLPTPYAAGATVTHLSADLLDGLHASAFAPVAHGHDASTLTGILPVANGGTGASGFVAGALVFSNGTTLAGNPAGLFWDTASLRLGVGTGTPSRTLHVAGDGRVDGPLRVGALEIAVDAVTVAGAPPTIPIPDNNPGGVTDTVIVPDLDTAAYVAIAVSLTNSDVSVIQIEVTDPDGNTHILLGYDDTAGTSINLVWPPSILFSGNLSVWNGRNPQGTWTLKVTDSGFLNGGIDGQIDAWSVIVHTGAITSGTWMGSPVGVSYGGTGTTSVGFAGSVNYSTGYAHGFSLSGASGQLLHSGGTGAPTWGAVNLASTTQTTGVLPVANGGTGLSSPVAAGRFLRGSSTSAWAASTIQASDLPAGNGSYIQNQSAVTQSATFKISGSGVFGTDLTVDGNATIGSDAKATLTINAGPVNFPNALTTADALVLGGDTTLYRSAADTLRTDDSLSVGMNTTVAGYLTVNGNATLGDANTDTLTVNAGAVTFPNATTASYALILGGDSNLYRSAADTLRTDDSLYVTGGLTVGSVATFNSTLTANGNITLGNSSLDALTINATPTFATATFASYALTLGTTTPAKIWRPSANTVQIDNNLIVNGNLTVGPSNIKLPIIAYGLISDTGAILCGSGNFTCTVDTGRYYITINGVTYTESDFVVLFFTSGYLHTNVTADTGRLSVIQSSHGGANGRLAPFHFMVIKP